MCDVSSAGKERVHDLRRQRAYLLILQGIDGIVVFFLNLLGMTIVSVLSPLFGRVFPVPPFLRCDA